MTHELFRELVIAGEHARARGQHRLQRSPHSKRMHLVIDMEAPKAAARSTSPPRRSACERDLGAALPVATARTMPQEHLRRCQALSPREQTSKEARLPHQIEEQSPFSVVVQIDANEGDDSPYEEFERHCPSTCITVASCFSPCSTTDTWQSPQRGYLHEEDEDGAWAAIRAKSAWRRARPVAGFSVATAARALAGFLRRGVSKKTPVQRVVIV